MDKYLLHILHDVNTIIIPGLGALTVTNKATGEIMFMSYLKHDDGNLAKYIAEKETIAENDAKNLIAKYVREIQAQLDKGDTYDMYQFGRFIKKAGEIDFEAWNSYQHNPEDAYADQISGGTPELVTEVEEATIEISEEPSVEAIPETPEEIIKEEVKHEEESPREEMQEANTVIEDMLAASLPVEAPKSIDEILNTEETKTTENPEEKEPEQETKAEEKVKEDLPVEKQEEKTPEIDTSKIKPSENVFIPKEELAEIAETQQQEKLKETLHPKSKKEAVKAGKASPKVVTKEQKAPAGKKKTILLVLLIFVVAAGSSVAIFYDKIEAAFFKSEAPKPEKDKMTEESDQNLEEIEKQVALEQENNEEESGNVAETENKTDGADESTVQENEKATEVVKPTSTALPYHIIAGSFGVEENANRLAKKYADTGKNSSVLGKFDNMYLVSYESFATKEEANAALKSGEVKGWVFKYSK